MGDSLPEYMDRYGTYPEFIFVVDSCKIIVGKPMEKAVMEDLEFFNQRAIQICDRFQVIDIVNMYDIFDKTDMKLMAHGHIYKIGDIVEEKTEFSKNYKEAYLRYTRIMCHGIINGKPSYMIYGSAGIVKALDYLPLIATEISTERDYNDNIDFLPDHIEKITLGSNYNQNTKKWPKNIKQIIFGKYFNKPVDNLPDTITHLTLRGDFCEEIHKLPKSLEYLNISGDFNSHLNNLPKSLKTLILRCHAKIDFSKLPDSLVHFDMGYERDGCVDDLPDSIETLILGDYYNEEINKYPKSLKKIKYGSCFDKDIVNLPKTIEKVIFVNNVPKCFSELKDMGVDIDIEINEDCRRFLSLFPNVNIITNISSY